MLQVNQISEFNFIASYITYCHIRFHAVHIFMLDVSNIGILGRNTIRGH